MTARPRVGLLGGTFDPIHLGHLAAARAAQHVLDLNTVRLLVSARPPHRPDSPRASEYHRLEMLRLAVAERPLTAERDWRCPISSSSAPGHRSRSTRCERLHAEGLTPLQIVFITGADAFAEIATWHRYPDVLDAAHFAVLARPGTTLDHPVRPPARARVTNDARPTRSTRPPRPGSSSSIAETPDVSSTEIRARASRGESLDGLVSSSVAAYIAQNHLYRTALALAHLAHLSHPSHPSHPVLAR